MSKELVTRLKDDFDGSYTNVETVEFAYRGTSYEIELSDRNAAEFDAVMARYIDAGRKVKRRKKAAAKPATNGGDVASPGTNGHRNHSAEAECKALRDKVRAFAVKNGIPQANTGYLRKDAVELWLTKHPGDAEALVRDA